MLLFFGVCKDVVLRNVFLLYIMTSNDIVCEIT